MTESETTPERPKQKWYWQLELIIFRIALMLIVTIPFVIYWLDYMSKENLNRSGIILNFMAGFLVAPDLIGTNRLVKMENLLELLLGKVINETNITFRNGPIFLIAFPYSILTVSNSGFFQIDNKIVFTINGILAFLLEFSDLQKIIRKRRFFSEDFVRIIITVIIGIFLFPVIIIASGTFILVAMTINYILRFIIKRLQGEGQLKFILVFWGIIFFIMGNVMQFVATF